jgi:hypothetical protein
MLRAPCEEVVAQALKRYAELPGRQHVLFEVVAAELDWGKGIVGEGVILVFLEIIIIIIIMIIIIIIIIIFIIIFTRELEGLT